MTNSPTLINGCSVESVWSTLFVDLCTNAPKETPYLVSIVPSQVDVAAAGLKLGDFLNQLYMEINEGNKNKKLVLVEDNADLIFPTYLWERHREKGWQHFLDRFGRIYPRIRKRDRRNCHGTYFGRMYKQIQFILEFWEKCGERNQRPRRSALQISCIDSESESGFFRVSCFEPHLDSKPQIQRGFPCLQQIAINYSKDDLFVSAFYPTQYIFDRAFGNYRGLCNLGCFMAECMGLNFKRLDCFINHACIGSVKARERDKVLKYLG